MVAPWTLIIKHNSVGVNFIDTYHRSGLYPIELPSSLGLEAVGEIVDVGADVKQLAIGDRVGYSSPPLGAYSEIRDLHAKNVFKINLQMHLKYRVYLKVDAEVTKQQFLFARASLFQLPKAMPPRIYRARRVVSDTW